MRISLHWLVVFAASLLAATARAEPPPAVAKTNPLPVYMHYMPWFDAPAAPVGDGWGHHWTMRNRDPNVIDSNGRRQIASHYYPKIGPYASSDPHVIEYHLLLMKLAGVDGVLINWYGEQGTNGDVAQLLKNSNAIVERVGKYGLKFAVVFEDRFAANLGQAQANMRYLREHYFQRPEYIRYGKQQRPLVLVFGPITFQKPAEWDAIVAEAGEPLTLLTLPYESAEAGANASGEFQWIWEDETKDNAIEVLADFLKNRAPQLKTVCGVAYPGFNDYYEEGGDGAVVPFEIAHDDGQTLARTLELANKHRDELAMLQLATWNDFGEGTMFEPTAETGFDYLAQVQKFTGVPHNEADLEIAYRLYEARQRHAGDAAKTESLDRVAKLLNALKTSEARVLLDEIETP
ncbi:glycoside hydrolase family 71/99-like protein [Lacipirellula parvula]|uniref:Uncharacterized protein n=1 Tax=Lacipirellula parvula TaxID=2650471 RepID=A0A5K7X5N8_9BACT|nr:glycoside hydrolase family 71/99-like protein [Lacipirellula parvula]BBO31157.1 hypothetical protein PLANPX_0769 [Lacipirellula parvula]